MSADEKERVSVLTERITNLIERLDTFEQIADRQFVRQAEFTPVRNIVYGFVGLVLSGAIISLLSLVFLKVKI
jgi:hypothetical protein